MPEAAATPPISAMVRIEFKNFMFCIWYSSGETDLYLYSKSQVETYNSTDVFNCATDDKTPSQRQVGVNRPDDRVDILKFISEHFV